MQHLKIIKKQFSLYAYMPESLQPHIRSLAYMLSNMSISIFVVSVTLLLMGTLALSLMLIQPSKRDVSLFTLLRESGSASASGTAGATAYTDMPPVLEMHIANNGLVYIKNATVSAVDGTTITADISWQSSTFLWVIRTSALTRILHTDGTQGDLSRIHAGDRITVSGMLDIQAIRPTVTAQNIRTAPTDNVAIEL